MKEERYFYVPDATAGTLLPQDEAAHAIRVLRLKEGDHIVLMDGCGTFYNAVITTATQRQCHYSITDAMPQQPQWPGHLHLAIAPTKNTERMEWLAEKATEIGIDELTLLDCRFSSRHTVNIQRLEKIIISAMKQSRKAWKPILNDMRPFADFITSSAECRTERFYIAHCYDDIPRTSLYDELTHNPADAVTVLIGPEGDFSPEEVRCAVAAGFVSVHLGQSRLRTETAGLAAVMMMQLTRNTAIDH